MPLKSSTVKAMKQAAIEASRRHVDPNLQHLKFNLSNAVRNGTMEGRDYLIVPMIMMTEGVHNGSKGPRYYPVEELRKVPDAWNHKPIVVYHPSINGRGVSACTPDVITERKVGVIMNTTWDGKLKAEAWLEKSRLEEVDPRVLQALEEHRMLEVSTGVFTEDEEKKGVWNGEYYDAIARNYRPDHLAILPDREGACSIADGAGLLRLNEAVLTVLEELGYDLEDDEDLTDNLDDEEPEMAVKELVDNLISNKRTRFAETDRKWLEKLDEKQLAKFEPKPLKKKAPAPAPTGNQEPPAPKKVKVKQPEKKEDPPAPKKPQTVDEYVANAPEGVREVLMEGIHSYNGERHRLVSVITANSKNVFAEDQLKLMSLPHLRSIAALAAPEAEQPVQNYFGAAGVQPTPPKQHVEEPMLAPTMSWDEKK